MTTLKEIANIAGVSRGTVDRVLNNRGSVNPETARKVREIVRALDYHPNKAGTTLAAQKKRYRIGVILFGENHPFFDEVVDGVNQKAAQLADYGVTTIMRRVDYNAQAQLDAIDALVADGIHGLMLAPYNDDRIRQRIDALTTQQIPVITVNTDIEGSSRLAYVGSDYYEGGRIAAGLFALMTEGPMHLGIVTGSEGILCHTERIRGLRSVLEESYSRIQITDTIENHDDEIMSYNVTSDLLTRHPEINALFFVAGGVYGGCRAVRESGRPIKIVSFDEVPTTLELVRSGVIQATISQQPHKQGSRSLNLLFEYLTSGSLPTEPDPVEHSILIRENI